MESGRQELLSFFVPGVPRPQGSKRPVMFGNRPGMIEQVEGLADWRADVRAIAIEGWGDRGLVDAPLEFILTFSFARPKADYRTSGELKENAKAWKEGPPDLSKLARAIEDALEGVVYPNDSRITREILEKRIVVYEQQTGVLITINKLRREVVGR